MAAAAKSRSFSTPHRTAPTIDGTFSLSGIDAGPLLTAAIDFNRLTGTGALDFALSSHGRSQRDLAGALSGKGNFAFTKGTIKGINLTAMLQNAATSFIDSGAGGSDKTDFSELSGSFTVADGIVKNSDLALKSSAIQATGAGTIDLPHRTLSYRVEPTLGLPVAGNSTPASPDGSHHHRRAVVEAELPSRPEGVGHPEYRQAAERHYQDRGSRRQVRRYPQGYFRRKIKDSKNMAATFSHRGVCVGDIDRSLHFYCNALGFAVAENHELEGAWLATVMELPDVSLRAQMIRNDQGITLELLHYNRPAPFGPRERRPNNQYGLTHLAYYVKDADAVAAKVWEFGGRVYERTRGEYKENKVVMMYCTDPDGTRIELMQSPTETPRFSHSGICITDIDRSIAFYTGILGFAVAGNHELLNHSSWLDIVNELDGVKLRAQMIRNKKADTIELLKLYSPATFGPRERRPMNQFGLTHLAFWVDDIDAVAAQARALGGQTHDHTRAKWGPIEMLHCTDPDGTRVELMRDHKVT